MKRFSRVLFLKHSLQALINILDDPDNYEIAVSVINGLEYGLQRNGWVNVANGKTKQRLKMEEEFQGVHLYDEWFNEGGDN